MCYNLVNAQEIQEYKYAAIIWERLLGSNQVKIFYGNDSIVDYQQLKAKDVGKSFNYNINILINALNELGKNGYELTEFEGNVASGTPQMYIFRKKLP